MTYPATRHVCDTKKGLREEVRGQCKLQTPDNMEAVE